MVYLRRAAGLLRGRAVRTVTRRFLFASLAALLSLAFIDAAFAILFWWSPVLGPWVVPPYGAMHHKGNRAWLAEQKAELAGSKPDTGIKQFDAELGWSYIPLASTAPDDEERESINSIGARADREYAPTPPPGRLRVVAFGDSFTHGSEVSTEDTWANQLEQRDPQIEVLNFGVGGYGTDQALLRFRREGIHGAHAALIGLMPENIGRNVNRYRPLWYPATHGCIAKPRFVVTQRGLELVPMPYATRQELVDAVETGSVIPDLAEHEYWGEETRMEWVRRVSLVRLAAAIYAYRRRYVPSLYSDPEAEPYVVTREILMAFAREALAKGAKKAAVVILPRKPDIEDYEPGWVPFWNGMTAELDRAGIDVIDPFPAFVEAAHPAGGEARADALFVVSHYSREGNALITDAVQAWLDHSFPERPRD